MAMFRPLVAVIGIAIAFWFLPAPVNAEVELVAAEEADPLTPKSVVSGPLKAPGAPDTMPTPAAAAEHPVVTLVLQRLAELAIRTRAGRENREALAAFYTDNRGQPLWATPEGPNAKAKAALDELALAPNYGLSSKAAYEVAIPANFATPEAQADFETSLSLALMTYARHARGGRADPGRISQLVDMRPHPFEPKSVVAALAVADEPAAALRRFHPQHDGFQRLQKALTAARKSNASPDTIRRLEVNLERWRWMPDDLGAFHVRNNLPEQLSRVYDNGKVVLAEKIVIGKPSSPTPIMSADMLLVIFHPSWGVPSGIKAGEVAPLLQRATQRNKEWFSSTDNASRALGRHQLRVSINGHEINPDSVDWTQTDIQRYEFSQPPSGQNVLGVVKFRFPNKHDVYMHDTPERNLFGAGLRAFSHGCMRVQNPIHLAQVILGHDKGWRPEKVQAFVPGGRSEDITLTTPVPVHLTYFTAAVDDDGTLHTYGDVYGLDSRVASTLAGTNVNVASAGAEPDARHAERSSPRKRIDLAQAGKRPVEKAWNPFNGW